MLNDRIVIDYSSEAEWLSLREQDYTSTTTSGLFGLSPYVTKFEIYHAKASNVHVPFEPNERTEKGKRLESAIAQEVGILTGFEVAPFKQYVRIPGTKIGSSFDYKIQHPVHGWIPLEIKAVDYFQHKEKWTDDMAPDHVELQLQHQMEVANTPAGMIAAATGIYDIHIYERTRDEQVGKAIHIAVRAMEDSIAKGIAPEPDFNRDGEVIKLLFGKSAGDLDATADVAMEGLAAKYDRLKREDGEIKKQLEAVKNELHFRLGTAAKAYTNGFIIDAGMVSGSAGKEVTADMVGTIIGGRSGYRKLSIKSLKG